MKTLTFSNGWGRDVTVTFLITSYSNNGTLAIQMMENDDGMWYPYGNVTVNLGSTTADDVAYVDVGNFGRELIDFLVDNDLATPTGYAKASGFNAYPEFRFNLEKLNEFRYNEKNAEENENADISK